MGNASPKAHTSEENKGDKPGGLVRYLPVFEQPTFCYGIAVSAGRLYLTDNFHHVVDVVDAANNGGGRVTQYGMFDQSNMAIVGQPPRFYRPWGVAVDETRGRVYVSDSGNHCVVVIRLCDSMVEAIWNNKVSGQQPFQCPLGLAYCPVTDLLYVVDSGDHCVKVLRGLDGQCVQVLGTGQGNGNHQMDSPQGVAVDLNHIYIADTDNHRVMVYAKQTGEWLFQIGQGQGSGDTQFNRPLSLGVDSEAGLVYVTDSCNHRVCVYRGSDGSYLRHFQMFHADKNKAMPADVKWDAVGNVLYVTTPGSTTISVYPC
eukprot:TRINITY_DN6381_c0_g2_i5.p1 TRINITY_DN6381_c0_g2~~TRINITY_DN6381_c0_g2_i5.p1  ORF type:complete len:314 (+),score=8.67 TRINITY_DN6381_c0_g2_i5:72-1013(+)